jgi:hypothetical protein
MLHIVQASRMKLVLLAALLPSVYWPAQGICQTLDEVVAITSEPDHKFRFDDGKLRIYEVFLPKGKWTLPHEHRADSFTVFINSTEITNEPSGGKPVVVKIAGGRVGFASTAKGPYSHRVMPSGDTAFHVVGLELLSPTPASASPTAQRSGSAFKVALENPRGRAYRITLGPGEATDTFVRPRRSVLFAISAGRLSEIIEGGLVRLWDFEPGHFKWLESSEKLLLKNEGTTPIDLVEIEVF